MDTSVRSSQRPGQLPAQRPGWPAQPAQQLTQSPDQLPYLQHMTRGHDRTADNRDPAQLIRFNSIGRLPAQPAQPAQLSDLAVQLPAQLSGRPAQPAQLSGWPAQPAQLSGRPVSLPGTVEETGEGRQKPGLDAQPCPADNPPALSAQPAQPAQSVQQPGGLDDLPSPADLPRLGLGNLDTHQVLLGLLHYPIFSRESECPILESAANSSTLGEFQLDLF